MTSNYSQHILSSLNNSMSEMQDQNQDQVDDGHKLTYSSEPKISMVVNSLQNNLYGCDILLCLFMSALESYRVDRCLRPFPPMYIKDQNKEIDQLRAVCKSIPSLDNIVKNPLACSKEMTNLLAWLLCQKDQPQLKKINYSEAIVPNQVKKSLQPHYIYEVVYPGKAETNWNKRKGTRSSLLGYHGSLVDNFYSILKVGLQQHFSSSREPLYGKGIYLTTEITLSMAYAPFGYSWTNSAHGSKNSIIAVCEVIDDVDKVKCKDSKYKQRAINQDSISGSIPDKYLVVTDSDMVRLKYLFVYKQSKASSVKSWMHNHMMLLFTVSYIVILVCIGFFQGPTWSRLQNRLHKSMFS